MTEPEDKYPEYAEENIEKLAQRIAEDMDINDLIQYVYDDLEALYRKDAQSYYDACEVYDFLKEDV